MKTGKCSKIALALCAILAASGAQAQTNITDAASLATYANTQMSGVTSSFWGYAALGLGVFFAGIMITIMKTGVRKGTGR